MKQWEQLTEGGQIRRLRPLALAALNSFPITPTRLRLVGGFTNIIRVLLMKPFHVDFRSTTTT